MLLKGKNIVVTGSGRGIGKAVAIEFAKNGANVAVAARTEKELNTTVKEIEKYNVKGLALPCDLSTLNGVDFCGKKYLQNYEKCDILVNNAGMTQSSTLIDTPIDYAQKLFNLNIMSYFAMLKQILPIMIEKKTGKIILTSSVSGNTMFYAKKVAYCTSKAAVTAMGKALHAEVKPHNINVNIILPGPIETKMVKDLRSWGQAFPKGLPPEAISPIYLFLASDLSNQRYKGQVINQQLLFEAIDKMKSKSDGVDIKVKEVAETMKSKYRDILRRNHELVDFLLHNN